jgi:hypothetical protein
MLYCADYDRRNDLAYVLRVRCPWARVEAFAAVGELGEHLYDSVSRRPLFDCVVVVMALTDAHERISEQIDVDYLLGDPEVAGNSVEVRVRYDVAWSPLSVRRCVADDIADLLEEMRASSARKRGPKTQVRPSATVAAIEAVA